MTENSTAPAIQLDDKLVNILNGLLELNIDSQSGYKLAAADTQEAQYSEMLAEYADQRGLFVDQLSQLLRQQDATPTETGTLGEVLREGWLNLKVALGSGDGAIFAECAREDETVLSAYQDAFSQISQEPLLELLREQFTDIRNAYERVKALGGALNR